MTVLIIFDKKAVDINEGINMGIRSSFLTLRMRKMVAQIKENINRGEFKMMAVIFYNFLQNFTILYCINVNVF